MNRKKAASIFQRLQKEKPDFSPEDLDNAFPAGGVFITMGSNLELFSHRPVPMGRDAKSGTPILFVHGRTHGTPGFFMIIPIEIDETSLLVWDLWRHEKNIPPERIWPDDGG